MTPRRRDRSFLGMAAVAGVGGTLAIVFALGSLVAYLQHRTATPAFMLFACWGIAALLGAYACVQTYLISDDPTRPPRGGRRLEVIDGGVTASERDARAEQRAA